jgi:hypothetical protein
MIYVQRKRTKGFRLPPGTICCTRPGRYANPFRIGGYFMVGDPGGHRGPFKMEWCERAIWAPIDEDEALRTGFTLIETAEQSVVFYRKLADSWSAKYRAKVVSELLGHPLSCWCAPGSPCHVQDVLIPMLEARSS